MSALHVGIAGAGLLGRLLAWQLSRAGHRVAVFDPATHAQPVARSQAPDPYVPTAAAFTAAGMLSPLSELDNAEPAVAALGWQSLALWPRIAAALPGTPAVAVGGSLLVAHRHDLGAAQRVLDRLRAATAAPEWQRLSPPEGAQALDAAALRQLEPSIQGPAHAWLLPGEGFIDTVAVMAALHLGASGADWHWAQRVIAIEAGEGGGTLRLADGRMLAFDVVIDVRGVGAKPDVPVRGVRGEVIWLDCPGHGLTRPVRLLHPRHRVYIVPRSSRDVLVGASEIESEDRSPVSLRSATELMAAAHSVVPALAEARILKMDVNLRPATPDNNPFVEWQGRQLTINGLFRHGWLLAPALVEQALNTDEARAAGLHGHGRIR
ncbi:FAD-dependent oxidoreductase [Ottowia testudinis]|uniref:FAD-dependent oxidoreductase n=1 Tax=Ottowia testudinis TaxID=2816950 RepID=A0A975H4B6_9BURK|nr:FAD-dependent oxidoreductase [Ottowia testudinis]QTD43742.1 FAD-dependent oxidoreductase [Ottowia testudinis]